jgi:Transposase
VWAAPGRNAKTLQAFFDGLTDEQRSSIKAVSIDMSAGYEKAIRDSVPDAQVCFDPFHVVQLGSRATDQVRRAEYNKHGRSGTDSGKWIKAGWQYSIGVRMQKGIREAVDAIAEDAWQTIEDYPKEREAQIAETPYGARVVLS